MWRPERAGTVAKPHHSVFHTMPLTQEFVTFPLPPFPSRPCNSIAHLGTLLCMQQQPRAMSKSWTPCCAWVVIPALALLTMCGDTCMCVCAHCCIGSTHVHIHAHSQATYTPLHAAAYHGHKGCVAHLLCQENSLWNLPDQHGTTPAGIARQRGYEGIAEALESWGKGQRFVAVERMGYVNSVTPPPPPPRGHSYRYHSSHRFNPCRCVLEQSVAVVRQRCTPTRLPQRQACMRPAPQQAT